MAQSGYTPISIYYSTTASAVPTSGNLANGELGLNIADMKLYAKNSAGVVTLLAASTGATGTVSSVALSGGTTGLTVSGSPITTSGTITLAGTLATANGGTNLTSFTSGGAVYATSTSALTTGTLPIASGGTGQTTANAAFNALVPSQTSQAGKYLTTDGTNTSWGTNPLGTVTSVAASVPSFLSIAGSPITTSGTLAISLSGTALPTTSGGTGLTSFTSGGVVYASSTSALATGSGLIFNGTNLGIGVTPSAWVGRALQIGLYSGYGIDGNGNAFMVNNAYNDTSSSYRYVASSLGAGQYRQAFGTHAWYTAASGTAGDVISFSQGMTLTSTGLGIGTSSPTQKLDVYAGGNGTGVRISNPTFGSNASPNYTELFFGLQNYSTGYASSIRGYNSGLDNFNSFLTFNTCSSNAAPTERMRITSGGDVGIGTSSPNSYSGYTTLTLNNATTGGVVDLNVNGTRTGSFLTDSVRTTIGSITSIPLVFNTNNTERARITSAGLVGIGTSSPYTKLDVRGNVFIGTLATGDNVLGFGNTTGTGVLTGAPGSVPGNSFIVGDSADVSGFPGFLKFYTTASGTVTETMRLSAPGNLLVGGIANRGTTVGTAHLDLFNGQAPAGTLTNGVSLYSSSGDLKFMDSAGNAYSVGFRNIPQSGSAKTSSYTLATTDVGEYIQVSTSGSIVVPDATFSTGDVVSIFNNTSGNITMTMSITTAYIGGTDTDKATITLATRGVATVLFISGTVCVVNGNVS